ncbi:hypothetical protein C8R43DRAFT_962590 [Mycena crocata]|nr:hypothetical protein C8R43DRAFT_962590 [Mycena crocata]
MSASATDDEAEVVNEGNTMNMDVLVFGPDGRTCTLSKFLEREEQNALQRSLECMKKSLHEAELTGTSPYLQSTEVYGVDGPLPRYNMHGENAFPGSGNLLGGEGLDGHGNNVTITDPANTSDIGPVPNTVPSPGYSESEKTVEGSSLMTVTVQLADEEQTRWHQLNLQSAFLSAKQQSCMKRLKVHLRPADTVLCLCSLINVAVHPPRKLADAETMSEAGIENSIVIACYTIYTGSSGLFRSKLVVMMKGKSKAFRSRQILASEKFGGKPKWSDRHSHLKLSLPFLPHIETSA